MNPLTLEILRKDKKGVGKINKKLNGPSVQLWNFEKGVMCFKTGPISCNVSNAQYLSLLFFKKNVDAPKISIQLSEISLPVNHCVTTYHEKCRILAKKTKPPPR